ncbi:endolytic transglycosylase MltG, partial [Patescibacteria group bacterium]|nr:endolytic transglycosylase MltG [Patescibacteria group bacterium]
YRVYRTASAEEIVNKLLGNFDQKLTADVESVIAASDHSLYEIVIMASILEREVRGEEDRRLVADLFWRRLDIGMRLQADSTVNYVTEGKRPALTQADTQLDSPYNTYKYGGLPPGPIGNPGLVSIKAAANPQPNSYWYFLTDVDGGVHYARNLEEHNRNKAAYLR